MIDRSADIRGALRYRAACQRRALRGRQRGFLLNPYRFGATGPGDANYASVVTLLHFDGANGSTSFPDTGPSPLTWTAHGSVQISTAQSKFGGASALFNGSTDWLSTPTNSAWSLASSGNTFELWLYANSWSGGTGSIIFAKRATASNYAPYCLAQDTGGKFYALTSGTGSSWVDTTQTAALSTATWYHMAFEFDPNGSRIHLFVNGVMLLDYGAGSTMTNSTDVTIGANANGSTPFDGYIDDFRFTAGVVRYPSPTTFTPPTAAFPDHA